MSDIFEQKEVPPVRLPMIVEPIREQRPKLRCEIGLAILYLCPRRAEIDDPAFALWAVDCWTRGEHPSGQFRDYWGQFV